jgi:hypothetical protein
VGADSACAGGISGNSGYSRDPSLALAPDGTPYIVWEDSSGGNREIYVRRWNGSSWEEVGSESASGGGISDNSGISSDPSLAITSDGTAYVAWGDWGDENSEIYVRHWNGSSWEEVGTGSASGGGISDNSGDSYWPSVALAPDGTPYVAWNDDSGGNFEIYVRRWNGSSWEEVGAGSASGGGISNNSTGSWDPSVAVAPDGTPYIAWGDYSGDAEIYVRRWSGSSWEEVGAGSATVGGISDNSGISSSASVAIALDSTPYVAWSDTSGGNQEIYMRRWNGSSWEEVGAGSASGEGISNNSGSSYSPSVAVASDGTPYVAWHDHSSGNREIYVRRWNGSSWVEVGAGSASGGGISDNSGYSWGHPVAIALDGTPYVAWYDDSSGNDEIYVRRCEAKMTLILVNCQKVSALFGDSAVTQLMNKLNSLAAHPDVNGLVIQVESDPSVAAAYAARGNDYDDKDKANAVAEAIKQVILTRWNTYPELEYLVIVGDDRVIPFYRTIDGTSQPDTWTLTDDFYTDREPTSCSACANPSLYIPDLAGGRLVETSDQIIGQIDTFLADNSLNLSNAAVAGYDIGIGCAQAHCDTLQDDSLTTDCTLIGDSWTKNDFMSRVLQTYHDVISISAHAWYAFFFTPSGELILASDFTSTPIDFARAIFYTAGCHAGYNVSSVLDLSEAISGIKKASYVANTGTGWGGGAVVWSDELMWDFTKKLVAGTQSTPGQALMLAKQQYYADHPSPDVYDEKITTESTLYGLSVYKVTSPVGLHKCYLPIIFRLSKSTLAASTGISVSTKQASLGGGLHIDSPSYFWPMPVPVSSPEGTYYTLFGSVTGKDGEPILPRFSQDVSKPELALHGIVFTGGSYTIVSEDPVIQHVVTTGAEATPVAQSFSAPGWYPEIFFTHNIVELESGDREALVAAAGQYNPNLTTNQQRLYTSMSFDIYYHESSNDWTLPTISVIDKGVTGDTVNVTVKASDASGIEAVVVAYTDGNGAWNSQSLTPGTDMWTGSFPGSDYTEIIVQVVDKAGNVNAGEYDIYLPIILKNY